MAKKWRNKGEEYIGLCAKTKTFVKAKEVGPLCRYGCFVKGRYKLDEIFNDFWKIEDYALKNSYFNTLMKTIHVQKSRVKDRLFRILRTVE